MNELAVFNYSEKEVRTINRDGEPWFVVKDVCDVLGIGNANMAAARLDDDEVSQTEVTDNLGRKQMTNIVNETGLYNLILRSDKPEAKQFKRWVTREVIPSIRKTGSYTKLPQTFAEALRLAADLEEQRQMLLPKADQYDKFISGENLQDMNTVTKTLGWGRNKLFEELRARKILMASNKPYQCFIDRGYFEVKEKPIQMGGQVINKVQTYATSKGVDWLAKTLTQASCIVMV